MNKKPNLSAIEIYSEKVADAICDDFFSNNDYITGIQITKLTNIESVNLFVLKRIFENWQKEAIRIQSPYFDYTSDAVRESLSHLMNALSKNIHISRIHFLPLLHKAVRDVLVLTFSPEIFYDEFFGMQGMKIPLKNFLIPMFGYIKIHPRLTKEIQNAIEEEAGINIKRTEAINISSNIVRKHPELIDDPQEIIAAFNDILPVGIFELHPGYLDEAPVEKEEEEVTETSSIDIEEMSNNIVSFDHENVKEQVDEAEEEVSPIEETIVTSEVQIEETEVEEEEKQEATLFEEPTFQEPDFSTTPANEVDNVIDDIVDESLKSFDQEDVKEDNVGEFEENSIEEFTFETIETPEEEEEVPPVVAEEPTTVEDQSKEEENVVEEKELPISKEEEVTSQILASAEKENESNGILDQLNSGSIKENMNLNDRFLFQKELFGGDQEVLTHAINRIDNCEDYTSAISLIKTDYAVKYDWDFTSDAVVSFISLVDNKF